MISYLSEISTNKSLFHSDPNSNGHQKLLIAFFALVPSGRQEGDTGQFLC